jgi:hypothetical protein
MTTRKEQIRQRCAEFHKKHPEVWELFVKFTFDRISRGFEHYSADAIFHRIRWETATPTRDDGDFKLNDHYTAFYARRFHAVHPEHHGFFRTRVQTSAARRMSDLPELGPNDYPETHE